MVRERQFKLATGGRVPVERRVPSNGEPSPTGLRSGRAVVPATVMALQRLAGNRAASAWILPAIQRLDIYGRAAAASSALPAATAAEFGRLVEAGSQAEALQVVVAAMTSRGELDPRLLRTSGDGDLWQLRASGELGAVASFRPPFADPDDPSRRLPNPRFSVSSALLTPGRPDALERLHSTLLHEYRHVEQTAERVNRPRETGTRAPGYANDPDEFDAYLSEVESSYSRTHMVDAALQAGVSWEFLADADRVPFRARWTAAQGRIRKVLGYGIEDVLRTPRAERYRAQMREAEQRARQAAEGAGQ